MKRKILIALLCCFAACSAALAFAACGGSPEQPNQPEQPQAPQYVAANGATCTAAGNTAYWIKDGKYYSDEACTAEITAQDTVIPAKDHDFANGTYTSDGSQHWKVCARSGCSAEDTANKEDCAGGEATCKDKAACTTCTREYGEVNAQNHAGGTIVKDAHEATCSTAGYTGDTYCLGCNEKIADGTESPATGDHDFANGAYGKNQTHHWKICANDNCSATGTQEVHNYENGVCGCGYEHDGHADENDVGACDTCGKELSYQTYFTIGEAKYTPYKLGGLNENVTAVFTENEVTLTLGGVTGLEDLTVSGGSLIIVCAEQTQNTIGKISVTEGGLTVGGTGELTVSGNASEENGVTSVSLTVQSGATLAVSGFKFNVYLNGDAVIESGATLALDNASDVGIGTTENYTLTVNGVLSAANCANHAVYFKNGSGTLDLNGALNADGLSVYANKINVTGGASTAGTLSCQTLDVSGGSLTVNGNVTLNQSNWGKFLLDGASAEVTINGNLYVYGDNSDSGRCFIRQGSLSAQSICAAHIRIGDAAEGCEGNVTVTASGDGIHINNINQKNAICLFEKGTLNLNKTGTQGANTAICLNQGGTYEINVGAEMTVNIVGFEYSMGCWNGNLGVTNNGTVNANGSIHHATNWNGNAAE